MKYEDVRELLSQEFQKWPTTKDSVAYYGFREYAKGELGIEYDRVSYSVVDEEKFMWFLLKSKPVVTYAYD